MKIKIGEEKIGGGIKIRINWKHVLPTRIQILKLNTRALKMKINTEKGQNDKNKNHRNGVKELKLRKYEIKSAQIWMKAYQ